MSTRILSPKKRLTFRRRIIVHDSVNFSVQQFAPHIETDIDILDKLGKAIFLRLMLSLVLGIAIVIVIVTNLIAYAVILQEGHNATLTLSELIKWICL